jgi:thiamine-monophosphate kinase
MGVPLPEKALIARIARRAQAYGHSSRFRRSDTTQTAGVRSRVAGLLHGIGDDCAVLRLPPGHEALLTTDFSLEGVHFRRQWHPAESVGHRCLARGLSDIAAMGGEPVAAFLSLALQKSLSQKWVDDFLGGFLTLARKFRIPLAGGDIAQSPAGVLADIVVLGSAPKGRAVLRSGAQPGDFLYVTGELGGSAALLSRLLAGSLKRPYPRRYPAHFFPTPRIAAGRALREGRLAAAMIDISDGLSTDLRHICDESGVGARIYAEKVPVAREAANLSFALHGGEDYELLFASRRKIPAKVGGVRVSRIGEVTRGRQIVLVEGSKERDLPAKGWEHFGGEPG